MPPYLLKYTIPFRVVSPLMGMRLASTMKYTPSTAIAPVIFIVRAIGRRHAAKASLIDRG